MALNLIDSSVWVEWFRDTKSKASGATTVELAKVNRIVGSFTMLDVFS